MEGIDQHYVVTSRNSRQIHVQDRSLTEKAGKFAESASFGGSPSNTLSHCKDSPVHLRTVSMNLLNQTPDQDSPKRLSTQLILSSSKRRKISEAGDLIETESESGSVKTDDKNSTENAYSSSAQLPKSPATTNLCGFRLPTFGFGLYRNSQKTSPTPSPSRDSSSINTSVLTNPKTSTSHLASLQDSRPLEYKPLLRRSSVLELRSKTVGPIVKEDGMSLPRTPSKPLISLEPTSTKSYPAKTSAPLSRMNSSEQLMSLKKRQTQQYLSVSSSKIPSPFSPTSSKAPVAPSSLGGDRERVIRRTPSLNVLSSYTKDFGSHPSRIPVSSSSSSLSSHLQGAGSYRSCLSGIPQSPSPVVVQRPSQPTLISSSSTQAPGISSSSSSSRLSKSKLITKSTPNLSESAWRGAPSSRFPTFGRNRCISSKR